MNTTANALRPSPQLSDAADSNIATPLISAAIDRQQSMLDGLQGNLRELMDRLDPVLCTPIPELAGATANPASDVGLVRLIETHTARIEHSCKLVNELLVRLAL